MLFPKINKNTQRFGNRRKRKKEGEIKLFFMRKDVIMQIKMAGRFTILILTLNMYTPFLEKVRLGHFFVKMEIQVYSTLLDERSHIIGPCQKGMQRQKKIQIKSKLKLHPVQKTNVMTLEWKVLSIKIIKQKDQCWILVAEKSSLGHEG